MENRECSDISKSNMWNVDEDDVKIQTHTQDQSQTKTHIKQEGNLKNDANVKEMLLEIKNLECLNGEVVEKKNAEEKEVAENLKIVEQVTDEQVAESRNVLQEEKRQDEEMGNIKVQGEVEAIGLEKEKKIECEQEVKEKMKEDNKKAQHEEVKEEVKKEVKEEDKEEDKKVVKKEVKKDVKEDVKKVVKKDVKEEVKKKVREDTKEKIIIESKEENKEEIKKETKEHKRKETIDKMDDEEIKRELELEVAEEKREDLEEEQKKSTNKEKEKQKQNEDSGKRETNKKHEISQNNSKKQQELMVTQQFYGGAIEMTLPVTYTDVSRVCEIPDNQEVYAHEIEKRYIIIEILHHSSLNKEEIGKFYFEDLAYFNGSCENKILVNEVDVSHPIRKYSLLVGEQKIYKNNSREADDVQIFMAIFMYDDYDADILITWNCVKQSEELEPHLSDFKKMVESFKIIRYSLLD